MFQQRRLNHHPTTLNLQRRHSNSTPCNRRPYHSNSSSRRTILPTPQGNPHSQHQSVYRRPLTGGFSQRRAPLTGGFSSPQPPRLSSNHSFQHTSSELALPPHLFHITRAHFQLVKCHHHLDIIKLRTPASLQKTASRLEQQLRPAFIDDNFKVSAHSISKEWLDNVIKLLCSHYNLIISKVEDSIRATSLPNALLGKSLSIVTKWAKRQLGRKLNDSCLANALDRIRELQPTEPDEVLHPESSVTGTTVSAPTQESPPIPLLQLALANTTTNQNGPSEAAPAKPQLPPSTEAYTDPQALPQRLPKQARVKNASTNPANLAILNQPAPAPLNPPPSPQTSTIDLIHLDSPQIENNGNLLSDTNQDNRQGSVASPDPLRQRKRLPTSPVISTSQLDLFGTPIATPPKSARKSQIQQRFALDLQKNVICGDLNIANFIHDDTYVFAHNKGKLSILRESLKAVSHTYLRVQKFIIVISAKDRSNKLTSNRIAIQGILKESERLFPNAKRFVHLAGIALSYSEEEKSNCQELNNYIINKAPSSCLHIPAQLDFAIAGHDWSPATTENTYRTIANYLN